MAKLFNDDETTAFVAVWLRCTREGTAVPLKMGLALVQTLLLAGVVLTEYSLFREIFSFIIGPAGPGEAEHWSVDTFAVTGCLMMLGYHILAHDRPGALPVRLIRACAGTLLPVYALGAGLAVASVVYFGGADALVQQAADASRDLFTAAEPAAFAPLFDKFIAGFPVVFSLACGALVVVNLHTAHRLVTLITANLEQIGARLRAARDARAAMAVIRETEKVHFALCQQRDALLAITPHDLETATARDILGVISEALRSYEQLVVQHETRVGNIGNRFAPPQTNVDPKQVEKRLQALRAINVKSITASLRAATKE